MAKLCITGTILTLATVDYSSQIAEASLEVDAAALDSTNMSSAGWMEKIGGLKSGKLTVHFKKDADLSGLDAAMFAALGAPLAFVLKETSAANSATNPAYSGSVLVTQWTPIAGAVGALFEGNYSWDTTGAVARATS